LLQLFVYFKLSQFNPTCHALSIACNSRFLIWLLTISLTVIDYLLTISSVLNILFQNRTIVVEFSFYLQTKVNVKNLHHSQEQRRDFFHQFVVKIAEQLIAKHFAEW